jgi:hypothetical protein
MNQNASDGTGERTGRKRIPVPILLIACLYLAVGIGGFVVDHLVSIPCGRQSLFPKQEFVRISGDD